MPSTKTTNQQIEAVNDNILVIVGRLLEATKVASDGLKTLSDEARHNFVVSQATQQTVVILQQALGTIQLTVTELDRIVRSGGGGAESLVTQVRLSFEEAARLKSDHKSIGEAVSLLNSKFDKISDDLDTRLGSLEQVQASTAGGKSLLVYVLIGVGWLITTGIAVYGAVRGK